MRDIVKIGPLRSKRKIQVFEGQILHDLLNKPAKGKKKYLENKQIYCVPSVHWDREWYRPFTEFQFYLVELMDQVLELLTNNKMSFFHADGYSALIEDYLAKRPEKLAAIKELASVGKLEIGPWYIQGDMFLPSGEAIIRNLEIGTALANDYGMEEAGIPYAPDSFGHSSDIPKILKHLGFETYYFCRGLGNHLKNPATEFIWKSDDGSSILAIAGFVDVFDPPFDISGKWLCGAYGLGMELPEEPAEFRNRIKLIMDHAEKFMCSGQLLMMCGCDHLLPQKHLKSSIEKFNTSGGALRCLESTLKTYVNTVLENIDTQLQSASGELMDGRFLGILNGTASSRIYLKQMNFKAQNLLEGYLEPWTAFASIYEGREYAGFLKDAWKLVLKNQAHDSICGCSVDAVHLEMEQRYREVFQLADTLFERVTRICMGDGNLRTELLDTDYDQFRIGVFTAIPLNNDNPFTLEIKLPEQINLKDYSLMDLDSGKNIAFEILDTSPSVASSGPFIPSHSGKILSVTRIIVDSADLPAYGYKILQFSKQKTNPVKLRKSTKSEPFILGNEYLSVKINPDGHLTVKSAEGSFTREFSSLLYFEEQADIGDEYVFMPLKDENPLNSRNRKTKIKWLVKSDFVQQVEIISSLECPVSYDEKNNIRSREKSSLKIRTVLTLTKGSRRLDVVNQVDNTISDHRLRVCFDIPWQVNNYFAQTQFSSKCHSVQLPPESQNWREVPTAIRRNFGWLAAWEENGENGFAVMPQGLHEHTVENNTLKLTLLRSVGILGKQAGPGILTPDAQCLGRQTFEYSLVFFNRNSIPGNYLWQEYQSYTRPPKAIICSISSEITKYKHSFFSLKSEKLVLSALRKRQNKKGREVRLYNISDEEALGTINVYVKDGSGLEHYFKELSIVPHALKMLEMNPDVRFSPK